MGKPKVPIEVLIESYQRLRNVWKVAEEVGLCGQSVQERLVRMGIMRNNPHFTNEEKERLLRDYTNYLLEGKLQQLADEMGRTKPFICRKARLFGLTDIKRSPTLIATYQPSIKPGFWKDKTHPRGMLGKKHTLEVRDKLSDINRRNQLKISEDIEKRAAISRKTLTTKMAKGSYVQPRPKASWKAAWREIGGKKNYYRSKWEANYARYLQFLKQHGEIVEWEHEPQVFWFEGIKRGCMSYLPDFRVTYKNKIEFHEVKGWMDDRSKTKINRMRIYHPDIVLRVIDGSWFKSQNRKLSRIIPEWE